MALLKNTTKKASAINPREMIIFSYPKVGKTKILTELPGNYLIIDFEGGTDYYDDVEARNINNLTEFNKLRDEFIEVNPMYDFIALDTITSLYAGIINSIAVQMYNKDEKKNKSLDWDITLLAYGVGYSYKRAALAKVIKFFKKYTKFLILTGHVADRSLSGNGEESTVKDLDVEGKLKNILALKTDAIALLSRTSKFENTLSFTAGTGLIGGTRVPHLSGKDIVISTEDENHNITTYWDKIYIKQK